MTTQATRILISFKTALADVGITMHYHLVTIFMLCSGTMTPKIFFVPRSKVATFAVIFIIDFFCGFRRRFFYHCNDNGDYF